VGGGRGGVGVCGRLAWACLKGLLLFCFRDINLRSPYSRLTFRPDSKIKEKSQENGSKTKGFTDLDKLNLVKFANLMVDCF
jgi:hypothetical protein